MNYMKCIVKLVHAKSYKMKYKREYNVGLTI